MDTPFEGWAILELMGHRTRPGYVREVEMAGSKLMRVDIPVSRDEAGQDRMVTEFYSAAAIYSLRPCTEDMVRTEVSKYGGDPRPVHPLDYQPRIARRDVDDDDGPGF